MLTNIFNVFSNCCMSTWLRKAIDCLPELRQEFEQPDLTPYDIFMKMLPALKTAHATGDTGRLKDIYQYAAWCFEQKDKRLWNSAGVSFYEHLADDEDTLRHFTTWVPRDIYFRIRELLEFRAGEEIVKELDRWYK